MRRYPQNLDPLTTLGHGLARFRLFWWHGHISPDIPETLFEALYIK